MFDVGFSLQVDGYAQQDALYLADGPWGIDYNANLEQIASFDVANNPIAFNDDLYEIERQPTVSGTVTGNVNLFRHVLPGDQTLDVSDFEALQFYMTSDNPIEVILMPEQLEGWNNRLRYTIAPNSENTFYNIAFSDFVDANGQSGTITDVKTIVFSVLGDYANAVPFNLGVSEVAFGAQQSLGINDFETEDNTLHAFPNPMQSNTTINFTMAQNETVQFVVYDQLGKQVYSKTYNAIAGQNSITFNRGNLSAGVYFCKIANSQLTYNPLKLIIK